MSKHTPWKVSVSHSGGVYVHTGPTWQEGTICKVELGGLAMGQQIAALPDLLAACELTLAHLTSAAHRETKIIPPVLAALRASIAKATGGDL